MTTNFSHTNCSHPKTSKARADCRKAQKHSPAAHVAYPSHLTTTDHMGRADAVRLAEDLFAAHGLIGWTVKFITARRKAGHCDYLRRQVALSLPLMAQRSWDDTHKTIIHEVAHALTPGHKHDQVWAAKDIELGGTGDRCFQHTDETAPYHGVCAAGVTHVRYTAPKRPDAEFRCQCPGTRGSYFKFVPNPGCGS